MLVDLDILLAGSYNSSRDGTGKPPDEEWILHRLSDMLDPGRLTHSLGVRDACVTLATRYGADVDKARLAGLVHDCAKGLDDRQLVQLAARYEISVSSWQVADLSLMHGPVGACLARELFGISDDDVLHAVAVHTTGCEDMGVLDLVLFVADYIEPNRTFGGVDEIRTAAEQSLELAALKGYAATVRHLLEADRLIHPSTIHSRNSLLTVFLRSKAQASKE